MEKQSPPPGLAKVQKGVTIFPYGVKTVTIPDSPNRVCDLSVNGEFTLNETQWQAFELAGAVFLPAAGYRNSNYPTNYPITIENVNTQCHYWTATHYDDPHFTNTAYSVFSSYEGAGAFNYAFYDYRYSGCSVRLAGVK